MLHPLTREIYMTSGGRPSLQPHTLTHTSSYIESDRPHKVGVLFPLRSHQSWLIIMIDGGGARANEGRKTFRRAQLAGVR